VLKAVVKPGHRASEADFARSLLIIRERLRRLGVRATVTHPPSSLLVVLDLPDAKSAARLPPAALAPGVLELYDLEADLARPSIDAHGIPVASTKPLAARPQTVLITCGRASAFICPGVSAPPTRTYYYLFKHEPSKGIPEMTGNDLKLSETRLDFDPLTNEPIVLLSFTTAGRKKFQAVTRVEAERGRMLVARTGNADQSLQHFAIVLDDQIKSFPSIDFRQYPDGIDPVNGAEITGLRSVREAKALAVVLQTGALPVHFIRIR
jgi:preprotein translocase subunit SecD